MLENEHEIELEKLLSGSMFSNENPFDTDIWEAGFNVDRQLIYSKIGPFEKVFLRPEKYAKRFYHTVYPLAVEDWEIAEKIELYDGFCTMNAKLEIRFQATLKYAENNLEILPEINQHIKNAYQNQLLSLIHKELKNLPDGSWVDAGLGEFEKKIALLISETLVLHNIQAQVLCSLKPYFEEFPHVQLTKESIHLSVLKKDYEDNDKTRQELFRQEIENEKRNQQHKQLQLQQLDRDLEIERRKQALEADHKRLVLAEKEGQQIEHFAIEKRLYAEKVEHENRLKEMHLEAELQEQKKQRERERALEEKEQVEILSHQQKLNERQLQADILKYEEEQKRWNQAKENVRTQKLALKQKRKEAAALAKKREQERKEREINEQKKREINAQKKQEINNIKNKDITNISIASLQKNHKPQNK